MNVFDLPVHPAADVFPMLDDDELKDLAADIQANGLQHPIVVGDVDGTDMLIDGRNRLAACKLVGVEPEVRQLNGHDPEALILSENIIRRHNTRGQRAMCVAMMYPEGEKGGRGKKTISEMKEFVAALGNNISKARTILHYAPELVEPVRSGARSITDAYEEAKQRKKSGNDDTEKLNWLKSVSPDLADKVVEGELTLAGAIAEHHERERLAKQNRQGYWDILTQLQNYGRVLSESGVAELAEFYAGHGDETDVDLDVLVDDYLTALTSLKKRRSNNK